MTDEEKKKKPAPASPLARNAGAPVVAPALAPTPNPMTATARGGGLFGPAGGGPVLGGPLAGNGGPIVGNGGAVVGNGGAVLGPQSTIVAPPPMPPVGMQGASSLARGVKSLPGGNPAVANVVAQQQNAAPPRPLFGPANGGPAFGGPLAGTATRPAVGNGGPIVGNGGAVVGNGTAIVGPPQPAAPAPVAPQPSPLARGDAQAAPVQPPTRIVAPPGAAPQTPAMATTSGQMTSIVAPPAPMPNQFAINAQEQGLATLENQSQIPIAPVNAPTTLETAQAGADLAATPMNRRAQAVGEAQMANAQIGDNMGAKFDDAATNDIANRMRIVADNPDADPAMVMLEKQVMDANAAMAQSPLARRNAGDRVAVQGMRDAAMPVEKAKAELAKSGKVDTATIKKQTTAKANAIREKDFVARGRDDFRQDQINRANIAKASERPGQLEESRNRRMMMGAANRMFGLARGTADSRLRSNAVAGATELAKQVDARPQAPRTTFADIQRQDEQRGLIRDVERTRADGAAAAGANRYPAKLDPQQGAMIENARDKHRAAANAYEAAIGGGSEAAKLLPELKQAVIDAQTHLDAVSSGRPAPAQPKSMIDGFRDAWGGGGQPQGGVAIPATGPGSKAQPRQAASLEDADKLGPGYYIINGRLAIVE